jgi:hypothetical protein
MRPNHLAVPKGCLLTLSRNASDRSAYRGGGRAAHVEFDVARQLDDCFGMMTVFEQRVFDGLRTADEQAAIETVLFLGDPLAAPVPADKNDGRRRITRWRFDELHVGIPSEADRALSDSESA